MLKTAPLTKIGIIFLAALIVWLQAPVPAQAKLKCSRLIKTPGGEKLINSCGQCRIIKVQRKRPGSDAPISRTLTMAPRTTTDLSFRGPGQSRITSDAACQPGGTDGSTTGARKGPQADSQRCIVMQRTQKAGVTGLGLANTCSVCRTAVVDRIYSDGSRKSQNVVIAGKSVIPLPPKGAAQAGILHEKACK